VFNDKDIALVTNYLMTKSEDLSEIKPILLGDKLIMTDDYQKKIIELLKDDMELKSNVDLKNPNVLIALRTSSSSQSAKKSSKSKGKDKSSKKQALSDEPIVDLSFMNEHQLQKKISEKVKDISDDVLEVIVDYMFR
jgi:hypothetical protein